MLGERLWPMPGRRVQRQRAKGAWVRGCVVRGQSVAQVDVMPSVVLLAGSGGGRRHRVGQGRRAAT